MNCNINESHIRLLRQKHEEAVNAYLHALCTMWDIDPKYGYWIGDEVGGLWCYGDDLFVNYSDMRYVVENAVSQDTYWEWQEYCCWATEFSQPTPNLVSWCRGCPRVSPEEMEKLTKMKQQLAECIEETKKKVDEQAEKKRKEA